MIRRIIWAVDAFEPPGDLLNSAVMALQKMAPQLDARVEPVYVLTPNQSEFSADFSETGELFRDDAPAAAQALESLLSGHAIPNLEKPHVISVNALSMQAVDALSSFAVEREADAILVTSHGRSGLGRFFLGSFAETLLFRSKVPVMVVHPYGRSMPASSRFKKILFPTDFGPHAEGTFREVVELASDLRAEVTLFHSITHGVEPVLQSGVYLLGGGWMPIHNYLSDELGRRKRHAEAWGRWASQCKGVTVHTVIHSTGGSTPDLIREAAEEGSFDLIALRTNSGPISSLLLGSTAKILVRHAPCPVWILRKDIKSARHAQIRAA